jgi:hypothetical protein
MPFDISVWNIECTNEVDYSQVDSLETSCRGIVFVIDMQEALGSSWGGGECISGGVMWS